jgi:hypothetical protein
MENNEQQKLGAGIITVSIIHFIGSALSILTSVLFIVFGDVIKEEAEKLGQTLELSQSQMIIGLVLTVLLVIGVILILLKKTIGVYIYFAIVAINIIYSLVSSGFSLSIITSMILPVLMGVFISQKKELFGLGSNR